MEWSHFFSALVAVAAVKLWDWFIKVVSEGRSLRRERVDRVMDFLDHVGELQGLYGLTDNFKREMLVDLEGNPELSGGSPVYLPEGKFVIEDRYEEAFDRMEGKGVRDLIDEKEVKLRRELNEVIDILTWLDSSGGLRAMLVSVVRTTTDEIRSHLEADRNPDMASTRRSVRMERMRLREKLQWFYKFPRPIARLLVVASETIPRPWRDDYPSGI